MNTYRRINKFYHIKGKKVEDNWFTSTALMIKLAKKGFYSLGTLPLCRESRLSFSTDRVMATNGRGSFEEKVCNIDGIHLTTIHWHDKKGVKVVCTFVWAGPVISIHGWDAKYKPMLACNY